MLPPATSDMHEREADLHASWDLVAEASDEEVEGGKGGAGMEAVAGVGVEGAEGGAGGGVGGSTPECVNARLALHVTEEDIEAAFTPMLTFSTVVRLKMRLRKLRRAATQRAAAAAAAESEAAAPPAAPTQSARGEIEANPMFRIHIAGSNRSLLPPAIPPRVTSTGVTAGHGRIASPPVPPPAAAAVTRQAQAPPVDAAALGWDRRRHSAGGGALQMDGDMQVRLLQAASTGGGVEGMGGAGGVCRRGSTGSAPQPLSSSPKDEVPQEGGGLEGLRIAVVPGDGEGGHVALGAAAPLVTDSSAQSLGVLGRSQLLHLFEDLYVDEVAPGH
jgi:hypothetical protein